MKSRRLLVVAIALVIVAGLLYYFYGGSSVPAGQRPLVRLAAGNFGELRDAFNAASGSVRVIAMLSPT